MKVNEKIRTIRQAEITAALQSNSFSSIIDELPTLIDALSRSMFSLMQNILTDPTLNAEELSAIRVLHSELIEIKNRSDKTVNEFIDTLQIEVLA